MTDQQASLPACDEPTPNVPHMGHCVRPQGHAGPHRRQDGHAWPVFEIGTNNSGTRRHAIRRWGWFGPATAACGAEVFSFRPGEKPATAPMCRHCARHMAKIDPDNRAEVKVAS